MKMGEGRRVEGYSSWISSIFSSAVVLVAYDLIAQGFWTLDKVVFCEILGMARGSIWL
jgi:hypothetical protein